MRMNPCADVQGNAGMEFPGPSLMDMAEAAVQQMTSDQPASGETNHTQRPSL